MIEPVLARACARSRCFEPIDVLRLIFLGEFMLWAVHIDGAFCAVIVCKAQSYPRRRVLEFKFAAGSRMREWLGPAQRHFEAVARELKCDAISTIGRRGWARAGGGVEVDTVCVRELE